MFLIIKLAFSIYRISKNYPQNFFSKIIFWKLFSKPFPKIPLLIEVD